MYYIYICSNNNQVIKTVTLLQNRKLDRLIVFEVPNELQQESKYSNFISQITCGHTRTLRGGIYFYFEAKDSKKLLQEKCFHFYGVQKSYITIIQELFHARLINITQYYGPDNFCVKEYNYRLLEKQKLEKQDDNTVDDTFYNKQLIDENTDFNHVISTRINYKFIIFLTKTNKNQILHNILRYINYEFRLVQNKSILDLNQDLLANMMLQYTLSIDYDDPHELFD